MTEKPNDALIRSGMLVWMLLGYILVMRSSLSPPGTSTAAIKGLDIVFLFASLLFFVLLMKKDVRPQVVRDWFFWAWLIWTGGHVAMLLSWLRKY